MHLGSNNTNKLSPQELIEKNRNGQNCSNNTNKLSPQEQEFSTPWHWLVQIIQINLVLKNHRSRSCAALRFK